MSTPSDKTLRLERTKLTPQAPKGRNTQLIMALVAGLAAAALAFVFINSQKTAVVQNAPAPPVTIPQVSVIVATKDIPAQATLDSSMFKPETVPQPQAVANAVSNSQDLVNTVTQVPIKANSQITKDQIIAKTFGTRGLAAIIDETAHGYRAMTIALDSTQSVGGYLKPGDRVDVLGTFSTNGGSNQRTVNRTVLQNVYLLATGTSVVQATPEPGQQQGILASNSNNNNYTPDQFSPKSQDIPNATVLVTPVDAERLMLAGSQGKLMLVLRGTTDMAKSAVPTMDATAVTGLKPMGAAVSPVALPQPVPIPNVGPIAPIAPIAPPAPPTDQITVIRGSDARQVSVPS